MDEIEQVAHYMKARHLLLATAESCTAGLIAARLVDYPDAGRILDCAFVTYSPTAKQACLGISEATIKKWGLTSEPLSLAMAHGALGRSPANIVIANTGVTESMPDGTPAGTQCFAWVFRGPHGNVRSFSETRQFRGRRNEIRSASADYALTEMVSLHKSILAGVS